MSKFLERIKDPSDIRSLNYRDLKELAREIRERIIRVVSMSGGHLASSLGAVELTIAVHYALNTPADRVIWDVGHQAYAHKLLTGRNDRFDTIRQTNGLSGFLKPHESPYDVFAAGHASTSLAAALGIAKARDLKGEDYKVVPIIGDGSMTCGLVFEAMNTTSDMDTDYMVILNDNEMSISPNVGGVSRIFNRIITDDWYNYTKNRLEEMMNSFKIGERDIGKRLVQFSHRLEESIKGFLVPGVFFEELGFRYIGPIDGHDLEALIPAVKKTANFKGPRILHVVTKKGKGYGPAEQNPEKYHSAPAFHIRTGKPKKQKKMSFTSVFGETLVEMAKENDRIVAITAAMPSGTGLKKFSEIFPERFFDFGIAESAAVTTAAGMAREGLRPVVAIYSTFLQRSFDMVIHDAALQKLPVIFALDRAGLVGKDGPTHHGTFDLSYLRMIPEMTLAAPRDEEELRDVMFTALAHDDGPFAFRYPRGGSGLDRIHADRKPRNLKIPEGVWLKEGGGVALIGVGIMAIHALRAAELLEKDGIRIGVADARFVKPLDEKLILEALEKYDKVITIEDNALCGGFGSGVNEFLVSRGAGRFCETLGLPDRFIEHGAPADLYERCGLSPEKIVQRVRACLSEKS